MSHPHIVLHSLVTVRRESGVVFGTSSPSKVEDLALKSIAQGDFIDRGVKRRRRSSVVQYRRTSGDDQEDGVQVMTLPASSRVVSKMSVRGGKAISRMTKAEVRNSVSSMLNSSFNTSFLAARRTAREHGRSSGCRCRRECAVEGPD